MWGKKWPKSDLKGSLPQKIETSIRETSKGIERPPAESQRITRPTLPKFRPNPKGQHPAGFENWEENRPNPILGGKQDL